jgi:hypothetical protein
VGERSCLVAHPVEDTLAGLDPLDLARHFEGGAVDRDRIDRVRQMPLPHFVNVLTSTTASPLL